VVVCFQYSNWAAYIQKPIGPAIPVGAALVAPALHDHAACRLRHA
jgi:hypothetical protein